LAVSTTSNDFVIPPRKGLCLAQSSPDMHGGQYKTELRRTASLLSTFPHITFRMLEWVLEITPFSSQTCLTLGEQIIKYCLNFVSGNCRYFALDETAALLLSVLSLRVRLHRIIWGHESHSPV